MNDGQTSTTTPSRRLVVAGAVGALLTAGLAAGPAWGSATAPDLQVSASATRATYPSRTDIKSATYYQLLKPRYFRTSSSGSLTTSKPQLTTYPRYNALSSWNMFNNYNGKAWCGYFAQYVWTMGHQKTNTQVPADYPSSQAWMTETGSRFHPYSPNVMPQVGDALVWTKKTDPSRGHVAVVVYVDPVKQTLTWISGNDSAAGHSNSIVERSAYWTKSMNQYPDLYFRGFTSLT